MLNYLREVFIIESHNSIIIFQSFHDDIQGPSILVCVRIENCIELFLNRRNQSGYVKWV